MSARVTVDPAMDVIATSILGTLAFVAWLAAVVSSIRASRHRAPGVSLASLMTKGFKFFDPDSFDAEGQVHQQRFMVAFAVFFIVGGLTAAVGIAFGNSSHETATTTDVTSQGE